MDVILGQFKNAYVRQVKYIGMLEEVRSGLQVFRQKDGHAAQVYRLSDEIERDIEGAIRSEAGGEYLKLDPDRAAHMVNACRHAGLGNGGTWKVVVTYREGIRRFVYRLFKYEIPYIVVLSPRELPPELRKSLPRMISS